MLRNAFRNADDKGDLGGERFFDTGGGQWGAVNGSCVSIYTHAQPRGVDLDN